MKGAADIDRTEKNRDDWLAIKDKRHESNVRESDEPFYECQLLVHGLSI